MTPAEAATAPDLVLVKTDSEAVIEADGATVVVEAEGALAAFDPAVAVEPHVRKSGVFGELPLALVIGGVGAGLVVIALHHFRWGNLLIAGSLLAGALFRSVLPTRRAGLLAVRARFTDVVTMAVMGAGLLVLALVTST
ncbi:MAG TPA: DUF3017 domain-containing protein [Acidothermaceae bacterium]